MNDFVSDLTRTLLIYEFLRYWWLWLGLAIFASILSTHRYGLRKDAQRAAKRTEAKQDSISNDRQINSLISNVTKSIWPWLPIGINLVLITAIYVTDFHKTLTIEMVALRFGAAQTYLSFDGSAWSLVLFIVVHILVAALSIPILSLLTVVSCIFLGVIYGTVVSIIGATLGASIAFLMFRAAAADLLRHERTQAVAQIAERARPSAFNYLLFLRLVPIFPFWLTNLTAAFFCTRLRTFALSTLIGITPGVIAFAFFASALREAMLTQEEACSVAKRSDCALNFSALDFRDAITPQIFVLLSALGVLALIPVAWHRMRKTQVSQTRQDA